jgi:hypothetical protein
MRSRHRISVPAAVRLLGFALATTIALGGCGPSSSDSAGASANDVPADTNSLASLALRQRSCIAALEAHLDGLSVTRIDAFLAQTLNGLVVCDAGSKFAILPTRDVSVWLNNADGRPHVGVVVPPQPAEITTIPHDASARVVYQHHCIAWMHRYLPASIAKDGDDPDTAAADVFNGIEECDAVAGLATISRERLAGWVKAKNLN